MYLEIIFKVIGGLGLFLYGMEHMSSGMQKLAGKKLKRFLAILTTNRVVAIFMGIFVTMMVQSSSVSTVMTIGFVNASLLTLKQALGIIFGANIGTTATGWLLALNIGKYGLPILGVAAISLMFIKNEKTKVKAMTIIGLGMIFYGLQLMSNGLKPIQNMPEFEKLFRIFTADTYFGVLKVALMGALITAVVQSSAATLGITMTLASQGLIDFPTAVALVLGENVGTTITAFLATLGANVNAKRAAYAHTIVNIIGVIWVTSIFQFYLKFLRFFSDPDTNITFAIATAHTVFNITNVILLTPFIGYLADFLCKIVKDDGKVNEKITQIDKLMLKNTGIVIEQTRVEITNMGKAIQEMFDELKAIYDNPKLLTDDNVNKLGKLEYNLDLYQKEITDANFTILNNNDINNSFRRDIRNNLLIADEFETVSDYLMRITNNLKKLYDNVIFLSDEELEVVKELHNKSNELFRNLQKAHNAKNYNLIKECILNVREVNNIYKEAKKKYIIFGASEASNTMATTNFMDLINFYHRVADHINNIIDGYSTK